MAEKFLLDTNILIYYLGKNLQGKCRKFVEKALDESFIVSLITKIELLSYPKLKKKDDNIIRRFLNLADIINIDEDLAERIINVRKKYKVKFPDAIIAATAMEYNLTIITRNIKDFEKIKGVKIVDPFRL